MIDGISYRDSTVPSDYDLDKPWSCTIGKYEYELAAHAITKYLQANGDEWRPVPCSELHVRWPLREMRDSGVAEMPEWWLAELQRVRVARPGPADLIRNPSARGGLQLRYPNGQLLAAAHVYTDEQMAELEARLALMDRRGEEKNDNVQT